MVPEAASRKRNPGDLLLWQKLYDFTVWATNHTGKFPRSHRFTYAVRIENLLIHTLGLIGRANLSGSRNPYLEKIDLNLEELKVLVRLSYDLKFVNLRSYEFAVLHLAEIGRLFGGWKKTGKRRE